MNASWNIETPSGVPGAIGLIHISGDAEHAARVLGLGVLPVGGVRVVELLGVDRGVVVRWSDRSLHLMPHGGVGIMRALAAAMEARLGPSRSNVSARECYPEAASVVEAEMLMALSRAPSPLAVDLLLDQPRRWSKPGAVPDPLHSRVLCRLLHPPLVVAMGGANIGKSSLVNTLAGRSVSIVADEAGTTRDYVGVMLDLGGLVVRYVDTPGVRDDAAEHERASVDEALRVAQSADLLLLCSDASTPPPRRVLEVASRRELPGGVVHVALRNDLGEPPHPVDASVSVALDRGINTLVAMVRDSLLPPKVLADDRPWKFWADEPKPDGPAR